MNIEARSDWTGAAPADSKWTAIDTDTYGGPGSPIGSGATQAEAISDLLRKIRDAKIMDHPQDGSFFLAWWNDCTVPRIVRPIAPGEDLYEQFWSSDPIEGAPRCWAPIPVAPDEP